MKTLLKLLRLAGSKESTIGILYIDGQPECFILEDEYRKEKLKGETRIPAGTYEITLRTEGGTHAKYKNHSDQEIKMMHIGMLWLRNVPNFEYILIHIGNTDDDTEGCLLPGQNCTINSYAEGAVQQSTAAYKFLYPKISKRLKAGEKVFIEIVDVDLQLTEINAEFAPNPLKFKGDLSGKNSGSGVKNTIA